MVWRCAECAGATQDTRTYYNVSTEVKVECRSQSVTGVLQSHCDSEVTVTQPLSPILSLSPLVVTLSDRDVLWW